eukprot:5003131-Lingulodinium_polyedra.AAC.1
MACHPGLPRCTSTNDARCTLLLGNSIPLRYEREAQTKLRLACRNKDREWRRGPSLAPTG